MDINDNIINIKKELPNNVTLICVSKRKPIEDIREAYNYGERDFGENKVQELLEKIDKVPTDVRWHLIGHLQRNKVKYIVDKVYLIQSLDSIRLLEEIENQCIKKACQCNVLIEINLGREENKSGILIEDMEELLKACEICSKVTVKGIMAIIPKGDENSCREYFKKAKKIFDDLSTRKLKNIVMNYLSMGMSNDYMWAIKEGSNMVRIGQGIFGKRNYIDK